MQPFETTCILWRPEEPDVTAGGVLRFTRGEGVTVDIAGAVDLEAPELHGHAGGQPVTLRDIIVTNSTYAVGFDTEKSRRSTASVGLLLRGTHADETTLSELRRVRVSLDSLDDWYATATEPRPLFAQSAWSDDGELTMTWPPPPTFDATLPSGDVVSLSAQQSVRGNPLEFHTTLRVSLIIVYASPVTFDQVSHDVESIKWLTALVTGEPANVTAFAASVDQKREFDVFRRPNEVGREHRQPQRHEMVLPFSAFDYSTMVPNWMANAQRLRAPMALCFANWHSSGLFAENRLLNAATAAEALGYLIYRNRRTELSDRPDAVQAFIDAFPADEHPLLRTRLDHINDPSLADRLTELVKDAGQPFQTVVGDTERWIRRVVRARNAIAHPRAFSDGLTLTAITMAVEYLIEIHLLLQLGVSRSWLDLRLPETRRTQQVQHVVNLWRVESSIDW